MKLGGPLAYWRCCREGSFESDLSGLTCSDCSGVRIARSDYDAWRAMQSRDQPEIPAATEIAVSDTHAAKRGNGQDTEMAVSAVGACGEKDTTQMAKRLHIRCELLSPYDVC